jgi:murein DD-endopeptidase MepM/ murein hydrolase activator NlpD
MGNILDKLRDKLDPPSAPEKAQPIELNIAGSGVKSGFGRRDKPGARTSHKYGFDLSYDSYGAAGTPIGNIYKDGKVVSAVSSNKGVGNQVVVDYGGGLQIAYNHLDSIGVKPGQTISRGGSLGTMGATGNSPSGSHISYEFRRNGKVMPANAAIPDAVFNKEQWNGKEGSWSDINEFDMKSKTADAPVSSPSSVGSSAPMDSAIGNSSVGSVDLGSTGVAKKKFGGVM